MITTFFKKWVKVWKPISAKTRYIVQWMKCVFHEKRCTFQVKRCIFQLVRCIIPIWRPPDISGCRHLQNEMYISSGEMYISIRSHQLKYTSFHLVSGGCHLENEMYISTGEMYLKYTSLQLKYTSRSVSGGRQI